MRPMWVGDIRTEGEAGDKDDVIDIKDRIPPEKITPSAPEIAAACKLAYPS